MAKQTQTKAQDTVQANVVNDAANTQVQTDAFGEVNSDTVIGNIDTHNPYSKEVAVDAVQANSVEDPLYVENSPNANLSADSGILQPTIQEPIKPTLTDEVVYEDFSQDSTVNVKNGNGVVVKLSGTAAKILKGLDATTKIVK